jgi:hypothetical protein
MGSNKQQSESEWMSDFPGIFLGDEWSAAVWLLWNKYTVGRINTHDETRDE